MRRLWYNGKFGAHRMCARRQIKMSQYSNWLHSPTHFREHSVALLSRPNVHDLWRVRFSNFLTCGFYLGGLLISFTSFLCFNYSAPCVGVEPTILPSAMCLFFRGTYKGYLYYIIIIPHFVLFVNTFLKMFGVFNPQTFQPDT